MAFYDLGDVVALGITITDSAGANANATAVVCTVTQPDGTSVTPSVTNSATGLYDVDFTPTQAGRHLVRWVATGTNASAFSDEFTVRDLTRLPCVSYADALEHLNIPAASAQEGELRRFIDVAQDLAEQYVGQVLGRVTVTETYNGGTDHLRLRTPAAMSVASVVENGVTIAASDYTLDPSGQRLYRVGSGSLYTTSFYGWWATGVNNITVTYTAGFTVVPPAAQQGVLEILRHLWQTQRGSASVLSRNQSGDEFAAGSTFSLPRRAQELLDPLSLPGLA